MRSLFAVALLAGCNSTSLDAVTSSDSALLRTLPPGAYSALLSGVGATTGVALIEVYEVR